MKNASIDMSIVRDNKMSYLISWTGSKLIMAYWSIIPLLGKLNK